MSIARDKACSPVVELQRWAPLSKNSRLSWMTTSADLGGAGHEADEGTITAAEDDQKTVASTPEDQKRSGRPWACRVQTLSETDVCSTFPLRFVT
jgi:hypothetical protein